MPVGIGMQQQRRTLGCVPVLVQVGRQTGHARNPEVEGLGVRAPPRQGETAEARVDVQRDTGVEGDPTEDLDGIDASGRIVRGGGHQQEGVVADGGGHRFRCGRGGVWVDAEPDEPDTEQLGRFEKSGVRGGRHHHRTATGGITGVVAGRPHCQETTLGAAGGHRTHRVGSVKDAAAKGDQI